MSTSAHAAAQIERARELFAATFVWDRGHADVWAAFEDAETWAALVQGIAAPWLEQGITAVAGIEARGFLLGGAVAYVLGVGFHAIRKADGFLVGDKSSADTSVPDYRGRSHTLQLRTSLTDDDSVLLVDDWAEKGAQALTARTLIENSGAMFAGATLLVNQLSPDVEAQLGRVTALFTGAELLARPDYSD